LQFRLKKSELSKSGIAGIKDWWPEQYDLRSYNVSVVDDDGSFCRSPWLG
jgi:hypothetical protein